jgi:microcystin-dependent protein
MTSYARKFLHFAAHERPMVGDTKISFTEFDHLGWMKCDGRLLSVEEFRLLYHVIGRTFTPSGVEPTQFALPDGRGRVPGMPGNGTAGDCAPTMYYKGDSVGEQQHELTIEEMPAHNHGNAAGGQGPENDTLDDYTHSHQHKDTIIVGYNGGSGVPIQRQVQLPGAKIDFTDDIFYMRPNDIQKGEAYMRSSTNGYYVAQNTSLDPPVGTADPSTTTDTHTHVLNPAGGSQCHNNMQPTVFIGNMYIFCGRSNYGQNGNYTAFPYTLPNNVLL